MAKHERRLDDLVGNRNGQFEVFAIPDAARESLIRLRTTAFRPYRVLTHSVHERLATELTDPACPHSLYPYHKQAVEQWLKNDCCGLWEMATGTGKTIASLAAAATAFSERHRQALVVLVPYLHLLDQWEQEARGFGYNPTLCSSEHDHWQTTASSRVDDFKSGAVFHIALFALHATASGDAFQKLLRRLPRECLLLVTDEVHATARLGRTKNCVPLLGTSSANSALMHKQDANVGQEDDGVREDSERRGQFER